jgi:hypothetical protein
LDKKGPPDSILDVRQGVIRAFCWSLGCTALVALAAAAGWGMGAATAVLMGGVIVLVPNGWLGIRVSSHDGYRTATQVALLKFTLCGLGFGVLFALRPEVSAPGVFLGASVALVALPVTTALAQQQGQRQNG